MGVTPDRISGFLVLASCFALLTNAAAPRRPQAACASSSASGPIPAAPRPYTPMARPSRIAPCASRFRPGPANGNTYLFSNSGPPGQFSATLVDANHMQYSGGVATRTRAGACSAGGTEKKPKGGTGWATPSAGKTIHRGDAQCIQATNGNSEPKCNYRFTYLSSITKKMVGPSFQKWERVPPSAQ